MYITCVFYGSVCSNLLPTFLLHCSSSCSFLPNTLRWLPWTWGQNPRVAQLIHFMTRPSPASLQTPSNSHFSHPLSSQPSNTSKSLDKCYLLLGMPFPVTLSIFPDLPTDPSSHIYQGRISPLLHVPFKPERPHWLRHPSQPPQSNTWWAQGTSKGIKWINDWKN